MQTSIQATTNGHVGIGYQCRGNWRHGAFDGHVFVERINGVVYWVARLQCAQCGTVRVTKYEPETWVRVGNHTYIHDADYPKDVSQGDCRIAWLSSLLVKDGQAV